MGTLRQQIRIYPGLAALILAAALLMRILVPAGFMPDFSAGRIGISLCPGYASAQAMAAMPGMDHGKPGSDRHDKSETPCGFAGLATPGLAGADPIQLALAILFIAAAALFRAPARTTGRSERLRPPLRGPPAIA